MELEVKYSGGAIDVLKNVVSFKPMGETMKFSEAVKAIKMGNKVKRLSWEEFEYLALGGCGNDSVPICIFCETDYFKWTPSIEDLEADDWWIVTD